MKRVETETEARDYAGRLAEVRRFKQREMLRIAARDLPASATWLKSPAKFQTWPTQS